MLKSITIESWDPLLHEGHCGAKKLTLRNNGHVIYVEKDFRDKENTSIITHKTFNKETVQNFLDRAEKLFTPDILSTDIKTWFCDSCPDIVTLKKENGEIIHGQLIFLTYSLDDVVDFYNDIEKSLNFNVDLMFDNTDN